MTNFEDLNIEEWDVFVPIGNCRPTQWLNEYNLRFHAFPFDWTHNLLLHTVTKILEDDFNNFLTNVEEVSQTYPEGINVKNRFMKDLTFNFYAMHHFDKAKSIESQIKYVNKKHRIRGKWLDFLIKNSKKACLFTIYEYKEKDFTNFINFIKKRYPKTKFTIINCHHMPDFDLETLETEIVTLNNVKVINLKFNDTYTGDIPALKFLGNTEIYHEIMPKLKLSKRYQYIRNLLQIKSKLKSLIKLFFGKRS